MRSGPVRPPVCFRRLALRDLLPVFSPCSPPGSAAPSRRRCFRRPASLLLTASGGWGPRTCPTEWVVSLSTPGAHCMSRPWRLLRGRSASPLCGQTAAPPVGGGSRLSAVIPARGVSSDSPLPGRPRPPTAPSAFLVSMTGSLPPDGSALSPAVSRRAGGPSGHCDPCPFLPAGSSLREGLPPGQAFPTGSAAPRRRLLPPLRLSSPSFLKGGRLGWGPFGCGPHPVSSWMGPRPWRFVRRLHAAPVAARYGLVAFRDFLAHGASGGSPLALLLF